MRPFNSFLAAQLTNYVAYRRSLGYSAKPLNTHLKAFDQYLAQRKKEPVELPPSFFLEMRADLDMESRSVNRVLSSVRMFFGFLVRCGHYEINPVKDIPLLPENEIIPFIFSAKQVDQLLLAVCKTIRKNSKHFITDMAVHVAILLLARCGMRISEPLRLLRHHYRPSERTLYIEKTKFKKDRLIPIPKAVNTQIQNYLNARSNVLEDHHNPYLLAGSRYGGINPDRVRRVVHQAVKTIGVDQSRRIIGCTDSKGPVVWRKPPQDQLESGRPARG